MAASNKATALKDSFINAIAAEVGPEGMAAAGAFQNDNLANKLGMKAGGDLATVFADLDEGTVTGRNDGLPNVVITRAGEKRFSTNPKAARPPGTAGKPANEKLTVPMNAAGFKYYNDEFDGNSPSVTPTPTPSPVQRSAPEESSLLSGGSGQRVRSRSNRKSKASTPAPVQRSAPRESSLLSGGSGQRVRSRSNSGGGSTRRSGGGGGGGFGQRLATALRAGANTAYRQEASRQQQNAINWQNRPRRIDKVGSSYYLF